MSLNRVFGVVPGVSKLFLSVDLSPDLATASVGQARPGPKSMAFPFGNDLEIVGKDL